MKRFMKRFPWTGFDVLTVLCLLLFAAGAGGCTWAETIMKRRGTPDQRIPLGENDWVRVHRNKVDQYRCASGQPLVCDIVVSQATCRCDGRIIL